MGTGERVDQVRGRDRTQVVDTGDLVDDAVTSAKLNNDVYATSVSAIDPDDAAVTGTVGGRLSPFDHQHAAPAGVPAALTKTATSSESAGTAFARDAHVHATSALPWGIVGRDIFTSDSAGYSTGATTDFSLTVTVSDTRLYRVHLSAQVTVSGAGGAWSAELHEGGTGVGRFFRYVFGAGVSETPPAEGILWLPATATVTADVRLTGAGGGTLTFIGSATNPRQFWIEDIGPR